MIWETWFCPLRALVHEHPWRARPCGCCAGPVLWGAFKILGVGGWPHSQRTHRPSVRGETARRGCCRDTGHGDTRLPWGQRGSTSLHAAILLGVPRNGFLGDGSAFLWFHVPLQPQNRLSGVCKDNAPIILQPGLSQVLRDPLGAKVVPGSEIPPSPALAALRFSHPIL